MVCEQHAGANMVVVGLPCTVETALSEAEFRSPSCSAVTGISFRVKTECCYLIVWK